VIGLRRIQPVNATDGFSYWQPAKLDPAGRVWPQAAIFILTAATKMNNMNDTAADTQLQIHYDTMWDRAFGAVTRGDIDCDTRLAAGRDLRRGLTLIARPGPALQARFAFILDRLALSEPQQYRYPATDMHVTILPLFTAVENPVLELARLSDYIASVHAALDGIKAFDIKFSGLTMSRSAVLAQGFPCGPALETLRQRLRTQLRDAGLDASLDQRYRLITAHSTLFRFVAPLHRPQHFAAQLGRLRHEPLGCMHVNEVELVVNDWYMSRSSLDCIATVPLNAGP
jgi:2'-5' RNA ligase